MKFNLPLIQTLWSQYKVYIMTMFFLLSLIFAMLFLKKVDKKNPFKKFLDEINKFLFFPYPKFTGFIANYISETLGEDYVKCINKLFKNLNDNYPHSKKFYIIFSQNIWNFLKNSIVDNNGDLTTIVYKNYGILIIKNNELDFMNKVLDQLSSYDPLCEKIFIEYGININYDDFQNQLKTLFLTNFVQLPDLNLVYMGDDNHSWNNITGIDYNKNNENYFQRSYHNGFLLDVKEIQNNWINSLKSIGAIINNIFLINGNDDFLLNNISENTVEYRNKNYLNFWNKIYFFIGIAVFIGGSYQLISDYLQYRKMNNIIVYGNNILTNNNPQEQFTSAQNFVNNMGHLNPKKLRVINNNLKKLDDYFNKVYKSSVFNIYDQKIKTIMMNMDNIKKIIQELENNNHEKISDINYIQQWKKLMAQIHEIHQLLKEFKDIFNPQNINGIYQIQERIFKLTGQKTHYNNLEQLNYFINKFTLEIKDNLKFTLNHMVGFILNPLLLKKKFQVHQLLQQLNQYSVEKNSSLGMALLEDLSMELKDFIFEINKEIYGILDENQWRWPSIIQEDIDFLIKENFLDDDYNNFQEQWNKQFIDYKKQIFQWNKTLLLVSTSSAPRKYLLNNGSINLNNINEALDQFLNNDLVKVVNNDFIPNGIPNYDNKLIVWDLEKLEIIESFSGLYKELLDQWNNFNGNNFLMVLKKILDYKFFQWIQWFINDSIEIKKYNINGLKDQKNNFENSLKIFTVIGKNIKNPNGLGITKNLINHQIKTIGKMILSCFDGLWFSQLDGSQWNGKSSILPSIIGISDINKLNNIFIEDFSIMDNLLNNEILPFIKLVMDQNIIGEDDLPDNINTITAISSQLVLYKNDQDNHLKNLENQVLSYINMKNYDLFKLPFKEGFSNGNIFLITGSQLHNTLVAKAQQVVEKEQLIQYNKMVQIFNDKCHGKIPFTFSKNIATMDDIMELKSLYNNCQDIILIMEKNPLKYKDQLQWIKEVDNFFKNIEILNGGIQVKFKMDLQTKDNNPSNNNLIMRWHTYLGNKESHNILQLNGIINSFDKWEILIDIVNDGSISVVEYENVVPIDRGCLVFSNDKWGLWKFIHQYLFKETNDGIILQIKVPIILKGESVEQQWIITYIKLDTIPQIKTKGFLIK